MTDSTADTAPTDAPLPTALADSNPSWEAGPWDVHGIVIGEENITQGVSGDRVFWPRDTLEAAAESLVGTPIVDDTEHDDLEKTQPSTSAIIGEITDVKYRDGTGLAFSGEIDDPKTAKQVERGRVDVSPMLFRRTGEYDDDRDAYRADEVVRWRDVAIVSEGASAGNSIQPGAATALQAEALRATFQTADPDALRQFTHLQYNCQQETGKLDESEIPNDAYRSHYLFPSRTKTSSSYPVVGGDNCLYRQNVISAWKLRGRAPGDKASIERILLNLAENFDSMPFSRDDADALEQTIDEPAEPGRDAGQDTGTMTDMDLTDDEEALIHTARSTDSPVVVSEQQEALATQADALALGGYDDPAVVENDDHEALSERVETVHGLLAEALAERTGMAETTAQSLELDALMAEFETDEGEFDADALTQSPEAGGAGSPEDDTPQPDALSEAEQKQADLLSTRIEKSEERGWDSAAEMNRQKLADLTGDESVLDGGAS